MSPVHITRYGTPGARPTLLAHCFLGHGGTWGRLLEAIDAPLDALAFDMPGHGKSAMPAQPGDFHAQVSAMVTGFVTRPSLLIGHSFGGASVLRHALGHPETVTGMVLIEPVFFAAARGMAAFEDYARQEDGLREAVEGGRPEDAARYFLSLNVGSPEWDSLPPGAQAAMAAQMPLLVATEAGLFGDSGNLLAPGLMEGFEAPVLLLAGSQTTPIFKAAIKGLQARLGNCETVIVEGAGHMAPITHPVQTGAVIRDWMARTGQLEARTVGA